MVEQRITDQLLTLRDYVRWGASQFVKAGLFFGHGTDNALDEALMLVLHAVHLDYSLSDAYLDTHLTSEEKQAIFELFKRRINERVPAAYLTGHMHFAGLDFIVSSDVLVPRSPIAELIHNGFEPWVDSAHINSVLDLCTGSGCIGIACAYAFEHADVDLVDISEKAIAVAEQNIQKHDLADRVTALESDVYKGLQGRRYDLIVSNPPYVSTDEYQALPEEYLQEPKLGLESGEDGMDVVAEILLGALNHLNPNGNLIVEVGASAELLMARCPDVPFTWLDFEHGGDGVFLLTAEQLAEYRTSF